MIAYNGLSPDVFEAKVGALIDDPSAMLTASAGSLVGLIAPAQVSEFIIRRMGE